MLKVPHCWVNPARVDNTAFRTGVPTQNYFLGSRERVAGCIRAHVAKETFIAPPCRNHPVQRNQQKPQMLFNYSMSISARPSSGLFLRTRCAGVSVSVISSVGRTWPSIRWPPRVWPSGQAQHGMGMQAGRAFFILGDVAHQGDDLDLGIDRDGHVFLLVPVEIADHRPLESAQRHKGRGLDFFLFGEGGDLFLGFFAGRQHQNPDPPLSLLTCLLCIAVTLLGGFPAGCNNPARRASFPLDGSMALDAVLRDALGVRARGRTRPPTGPPTAASAARRRRRRRR